MIHSIWEPDSGKRGKPHPGLNILLFPWSDPHHPIFTCVRTDNQVFNQGITQKWYPVRFRQENPGDAWMGFWFIFTLAFTILHFLNPFEWMLKCSIQSFNVLFGGKIVGLGIIVDFTTTSQMVCGSLNVPRNIWSEQCCSCWYWFWKLLMTLSQKTCSHSWYPKGFSKLIWKEFPIAT